MVLQKKIVKKKIIEEEEVGVEEEGEVACEHCGGALREEMGSFKCVSCGRESLHGGVLKKKLAEKQVSPQEVKDFGSKIKQLSLPELADFCLRLFTAMYGYESRLEEFRNSSEKKVEIKWFDSLKGGVDMAMAPVGYVKDEGTAIVFVLHDKCWRLFYCSTKTITKEEVDDFIKTAKKSCTERIYFVALGGLEKGAEQTLEDYKDITVLTAQDLLLSSREKQVKLKTVNPAIRLDAVPTGKEFLDALTDELGKTLGI